MSTYIAFPASNELISKYTKLKFDLAAGTEEPLGPTACDLASELADLATQALIFRILDVTETERAGTSLLRHYGQFINTTTRFLANKFIPNLPNHEIEKLLAYLTERTHKSGAKTYVTFPIDDARAEQFLESFKTLDEEMFRNFMVTTSNLALDYYLLQPLSMLDTGQIPIKLAEASVAALKIALSASFKQTFTSLDVSQLTAYCNYANSWLVEFEPEINA